MTRYLRELLAAKEPAFSQAIHEFESATGNKGVDIGLSTEIEQQTQAILRHLGLDQRDSTPQEVYHALQALTKKHDEFIQNITGRPNLADPQELAMVLGEVFYHLDTDRQVWAVKPSVMRRLLKANPPRVVMKKLGYRSADSMIKRESVAELLLGARMLESAAWMTRLLKSYKKLSSSDFESRAIQIVAMRPERWQGVEQQFMQQKHHTIMHSKELGAIGVLSLQGKIRAGSTIMTYLLAFHYLNEIKSYSSFFKLKQVDSAFGELVSRTLMHDPSDAADVLGRPVHWKSLRRHFARQGGGVPEAFQPHVSDEDVAWTAAEDALYRLEPALKFWQGLEYVGLDADRPVSFNLLDNTVSLVNGVEFGQQATSHMQAALGNELLSRYLSHKQLSDHVIQQLEPAGSDLADLSFIEGGIIDEL
ncbi:MAG: hypothetical protein KIH63_000485 [Candidatus Saccharibacteria bacterium]|nr:hypothetical protein [Candidatus Saccharibacteria bacterium]